MWEWGYYNDGEPVYRAFKLATPTMQPAFSAGAKHMFVHHGFGTQMKYVLDQTLGDGSRVYVHPRGRYDPIMARMVRTINYRVSAKEKGKQWMLKCSSIDDDEVEVLVAPTITIGSLKELIIQKVDESKNTIVQLENVGGTNRKMLKFAIEPLGVSKNVIKKITK